jgi:hypothetical protein
MAIQKRSMKATTSQQGDIVLQSAPQAYVQHVAEKARVLLVDACTDAVVAMAACLILLALALFALSMVTQQQSRPLYGGGELSAGVEITR